MATGQSWIDEQAAEYADLVNDSSFSSVTGYVEDDPTEYQLIWEGGDLGVALTTNPGGAGVSVSRITGKGFPHGIKNVVPGDVLLAVNELDTFNLTLEDVVKYLQECDLPATLRLTRPENVTRNVEAKTRQSLLQSSRPSALQPRMSASASHKPQRQSFTPPTMMNEGVTSPTNAGKPMDSRLSMQERGSVMKKKGIASSNAPRASTAHMPPPPPAAKPHHHPPQAPPTLKSHDSATVPPPAAPPIPVTVPTSILKKSKPAPVALPPQPPVESSFNKLSIASNVSAALDARGSVDNRTSAASNTSNATAIAVEDVPAYQAPAASEAATSAGPAAATSSYPPIVNRENRGESTVSDMAMMDSMHEDDLAILDEDGENRHNGSFNEHKVMLVEEEEELEDNDPLHHHHRLSDLDETKEEFGDDSDDDDNYAPLVIPHTVAPAIPTKTTQQPDDPPLNVYMPGMGGRDSTSHRSTITKTKTTEPAQPMSTVHEAAAKGDLRGVLPFVRQDKNGPECLIRREPNHGQTAFHLAVKSGNVSLIQMMLDQFTHVAPTAELLKIEDDKGNTALHFAATKTPHVVHLLLEAGAPATTRNSRGLTPLIIAVMTNKKDDIIIVNMLLKFGANPNDVHDATTIIHTAVNLKLLKVAGALVRAGAKLDVEDSDGKTVFEKMNRASLKYLLSHIYFPPTFISEKERSECMLCNKKFGFGRRKYHCTHCGRLCCADDASVFIPFVQFPQGFPGRIHKGAGVLDEKRCCKTCYNILKDRAAAAAAPKPEKGFIARVIGIEWDEVNPDKLQPIQSAGRRRG
ncbi:hypothetical protein H310_02385 [Aphanomyces invadans]|uniref:FYVE-type domain-containing protein n=1 Tax=Aphanomyces invadans TaxID=157072 RepID=A0A024UQA1_9STRA|nr:hypothetical protein H310_02385 [Aphanomyces invadans]ETW08007.1 hypothetical protein H310_02385 [Aphanomyces invadans]RHY28239.1 hypothetical protein DYB32_006471 [Aphanomyces invadans]|eukprot:XP_008864100.1 hypothetical protein H310_02385 [Aphanomyces invadans]